jgi:prophage regulatory protein
MTTVSVAARLIRLPEVLARTGLKRSSLYSRVAAGIFPKPIDLGIGGRAVAWVEQEVIDWIAEQIARRDARSIEPKARPPKRVTQSRAARRVR